MKDYWCDNDDLLMKNIQDSTHRYSERLSSLSLSSFLIPKILHFKSYIYNYCKYANNLSTYTKF